MIPVVQFHVSGKPAPQGSKIRTRYGMREANDGLEPWREAIISQAIREGFNNRMIGLPVLVKVVFSFKRPASHYRTGRFAHLLRDGAPTYKATAPDLDKLQRAVGDALTNANILVDDDLIVHWDAVKLWANTDANQREGAHIGVYTL